MADRALVKSTRIGIVLPPREHFELRKSGAVALCMRDFARYSRFAEGIEILGAGPCDYADVPYRRLTNWRRWWRRDRMAYADAVSAVAADYALLEVQNRPYLIAPIRRRQPGVKLTLHLHNDPQTMDGSRSAADRRRLLAACEAIYCVSDFIRGRFLEGMTDEAGKTVTVLNGVALPAATAEKSPVIAFTGRVAPIKGVSELVAAFLAADLRDWRLAIAGGDPEGRLAGVSDRRIDILGQVSHTEAMDLLARAEIAAAPSVWDDPCPRAAIEALANGCALVVSARGGLPEIVADAGLYVDPGDIEAFAQTLRRLATDAELRRDLQAKGRARAAQHLEIGAATARLDGARARALGLV